DPDAVLPALCDKATLRSAESRYVTRRGTTCIGHQPCARQRQMETTTGERLVQSAKEVPVKDESYVQRHHERDQVDRQWNDPKKRYGRQIQQNMVCYREHES